MKAALFKTVFWSTVLLLRLLGRPSSVQTLRFKIGHRIANVGLWAGERMVRGRVS